MEFWMELTKLRKQFMKLMKSACAKKMMKSAATFATFLLLGVRDFMRRHLIARSFGFFVLLSFTLFLMAGSALERYAGLHYSYWTLSYCGIITLVIAVPLVRYLHFTEQARIEDFLQDVHESMRTTTVVYLIFDVLVAERLNIGVWGTGCLFHISYITLHMYILLIYAPPAISTTALMSLAPAIWCYSFWDLCDAISSWLYSKEEVVARFRASFVKCLWGFLAKFLEMLRRWSLARDGEEGYVLPR